MVPIGKDIFWLGTISYILGFLGINQFDQEPSNSSVAKLGLNGITLDNKKECESIVHRVT